MTSPLPPAIAELETRLGLIPGALIEEDLARARAALADATTLVLAEAPRAVAQAWALDCPDVVVLVALKAARREYDNPRGLTEESLGDHSMGLSDSSGVYLTSREVAQVRRAASGRRGGFVGTVRTPSAYEAATK